MNAATKEQHGLPAVGEIMNLKDPEEALARCNKYGYSEGWAIRDGAVVIYNIDDPPPWLPRDPEHGGEGVAATVTREELLSDVAVKADAEARWFGDGGSEAANQSRRGLAAAFDAIVAGRTNS